MNKSNRLHRSEDSSYWRRSALGQRRVLIEKRQAGRAGDVAVQPAFDRGCEPSFPRCRFPAIFWNKHEPPRQG